MNIRQEIEFQEHRRLNPLAAFSDRSKGRPVPDEPADTDPVDTGDTTPDTQKPATNDTTKAPATEAPAEEEKGCGGIIGGGAIALVATLGCALVIGKKREDK